MGMPSLLNCESISIEAFKRLKIKMLERDFLMTLTEEQKNHINELQSEIAIDNYCRKLFSDYYGD